MPAYSFLDIAASISGTGGSFSLSGGGNAKEGIKITPDEDKTATVTGADGKIMHSLKANQTYSVSVMLLKTSSVNAQLSKMYEQQRASSATWGQNTITVTDKARGDNFTLSEAAFVKFPEITHAEEGNTNEWVFRGVGAGTLGTGTPEV